MHVFRRMRMTTHPRAVTGPRTQFSVSLNYQAELQRQYLSNNAKFIGGCIRRYTCRFRLPSFFFSFLFSFFSFFFCERVRREREKYSFHAPLYGDSSERRLVSTIDDYEMMHERPHVGIIIRQPDDFVHRPCYLAM